MLGYVVPQKSELKLREFEIYQAYYCAVCHAIRDRVGQLPRLMLSYDAVFLAMMIEAALSEDENISEFRCLTHPWRRRNIAEVTPGIAYAADMLVLLGYNKIVDDVRDEHKIRGMLGKAGLRTSYRKVRALYPEKAAIIEDALALQVRLEQDSGSSLDQLAEPSSLIMEEIFDWPGIEDKLRLAYRTLGRELGRWVYIIDAVDDYEDDVKSGAFNPLKFGEYSRERLEFALKMSLTNLAETADLLPLRRNKAVLENIIYVGLNIKTDEVIDKYIGAKRRANG